MQSTQAIQVWDKFNTLSNKTAIIDDTNQDETFSITFSELSLASRGLAEVLQGYGAEAGETIIINADNGINFSLTYFACLWGGQIVVPTAPGQSKDDFNHIINLCKPSLIVSDNQEKIELVKDQGLRCLKIESNRYLLDKGLKSAPSKIGRKKNSPFSITFTSGTSEYPKGVCHSAENMITNVLAFNNFVGLNQNTRMLHVLPMSYMAGFHNTLLSPLVAGASVILAPEFKGLNGLALWQSAMDYSANATWWTPTILAFLIRTTRSKDIVTWVEKNLNTICIGTAPLPVKIKNKFEDMFNKPVLESYGMTEVLFVSSNNLNQKPKLGSVGQVIDGNRIEIRDSNSEQVPVGEMGELWIQCHQMFLGYMQKDINIDFQPRHGFWFETGDLANIDEEGNLFISGRKKDLIIRGGLNISPRKIEDCLMTIPEIEEVAVVGAPHLFWGEEVVAFVVPKKGIPFSKIKSLVTKNAKDNLPAGMQPQYIYKKTEIPRTAIGKFDKEQLKKELENLK